MGNLNGKEVTYARASGPIKTPMTPQIGPELSLAGGLNSVSKIVKMTVEDACIAVEVRLANSQATQVIHVPITSLSYFTTKPEAKAEKNNKAAAAN